VTCKNVSAERRQFLRESLALHHGEGRRDADVMKNIVVVEQPEEHDPTASLPLLCQRNPPTTQSAVRACLILIMTRLPGR
jgi:hypothetical protein